MNYEDYYNQSEIIKKCYDLITELDEKFQPFINIFLENHRGDITKDEMISQMAELIKDMNDLTMEEYNEMAKMYSEVNCAWYSYQTGRIVHNLLIEKWNKMRGY